MTTTKQTSVKGEIHIDHVSPQATLIMIIPAPDFRLNTHPGEPNAPLQDWHIWKSTNGRWILTADGVDFDSRAKRENAVSAALRLSGIAPNDRPSFRTDENYEYGPNSCI